MSAALARWLFLGLCALIWRQNRRMGRGEPLLSRSELPWAAGLLGIPAGVWLAFPHPFLSTLSWILAFLVLVRTGWRLAMRQVDLAAVRSRPADVPGAKGRLVTTRAQQLRSYSFDDAPAAMRGLSVVLLSDLHCDGWPEPAWYDRIWQTVKGLQPDLLLLAGDFLTTPESLPLVRRCLRDLSRVRPAMGCFAVLGNHDQCAQQELEPLLRSCGIELLHDASRLVSHPDGRTVRLAGTSWPWCGSEGVRACMQEGAVDIALTHSAQNARELANAGAAWILAGHSHGGQVALPVLGGFLAPGGSKHIYGHHIVGDAHLVVTSGLGCTELPLRFLVHPEIVLLRF